MRWRPFSCSEVDVMTKSLVCIAMFALCSAPALAEQRGQGRGNPGVSPQTIMDNADIRVTRVQLDAGAARPSHVHNEGALHLFIPITSAGEMFLQPGCEKE